MLAFDPLSANQVALVLFGDGLRFDGLLWLSSVRVGDRLALLWLLFCVIGGLKVGDHYQLYGLTCNCLAEAMDCFANDITRHNSLQKLYSIHENIGGNEHSNHERERISRALV